MNTPIYLALLAATAPVAKARVTSWVARSAGDQRPAPRPRLESALTSRART